MFRIHLDDQLINSALRRVEGQQLEFRHGCILGKLKLPIGAVSVVVIPSFNGRELVLAVPFKEIRGDITGKFFLSKLVGTFWGTICNKIDAALIPKLQQAGLPRQTISHEKVKDRKGDIGKIKVSMHCVNSWLAGKHPTLTPSIENIAFSPEGAEIQGELQHHNVRLGS